MQTSTLPPGIWYENKRNRYRVRIYSGRRAVHLSYHDSIEEAHATYTEVTQDRSGVIEALVSPAPKKGKYITVDEFINKYFKPARRKHTCARHRVYDWIHSGALPAIKNSPIPGSPLLIPAREATRFVTQLKSSAAYLED